MTASDGTPSSVLVLVRHAEPRLLEGTSAAAWCLSDAGRDRCGLLAEHLREHRLQRLVTSTEPKAAETGDIVAGILGVPVEQAAGLHEHERRSVPMLARADFTAAVVEALQRPDARVLGEETADAAHARFAGSVEAVLRAHPGERLAIVSHGTVIALFTARANRMDPVSLWRRLSMPCYAVLDLPGYRLRKLVDRIP